jgi:peptidyl-dipeptidase A
VTTISNDVLAERIESLQAEVEPLIVAASEAAWQLNITGEERWQDESARLDTELRTVLSRPEPYAFLRAAAEAEDVDPQLRRQAVLLRNGHAPNQISPETIEHMVKLEKVVEGLFNTFRADLDGERVGENRIREILESSDDLALRERAWEASKQIGGQVAPHLLDLVAARNTAARELGYSNYYSMSLELDELDEDGVFATFDIVIEGSQAAYERYKERLDAGLAERFGITIEELRPWHYGDPFFQEAPAADLALDRWFEARPLEKTVTAYFDAVGFDVRPILGRSDLYEREGKCQSAFCADIDRKGDVRILCNLTATEYWMATLLHELGHGVYDDGIDPGLPYFLRTAAHTLTTEASAMLFGRLSRSPAWLVEYAGMPAAEAASIASTLDHARVAQLVQGARWVPVMAYFERELYGNPSQDLNRLWWDLVERFQLVTRPEDRDSVIDDHADWAAKIHFSVSPAYYQNYLLGEILASQLQEHLLQTIGSWERYVESPEVARFLNERLYSIGRSTDWRGAIEHATGQPLDVGPFLAELASA